MSSFEAYIYIIFIRLTIIPAIIQKLDQQKISLGEFYHPHCLELPGHGNNKKKIHPFSLMFLNSLQTMHALFLAHGGHASTLT